MVASFRSSHLAWFAFTGMLIALRISMDGRGRWMDNVFFERLWRSLKHEDIYLKRMPTGAGAQRHRGVVCVSQHQAPTSGACQQGRMAVWREGTTGALTDNAVDMMDNARALPTCP